MSDKLPIASKTVCNTLAIAIYAIDYGIDDTVIAKYVGIGYNLETPQRCTKRKIRYDDDGRAYFRFYGKKEYLDEYIRL